MGSINQSHTEPDGGILLFNGELILLYCDSVGCEIGGKESVKGRVYLTTHRLVMTVTPFKPNSTVKSLCAPFCAITKCNIEQPVFGANYIEATVRDERDPNLSFSFKLRFSKGGAIEFAMAMNRAVAAVGRSYNPSMPPPPAYTPAPGAQYYQAPPTVYAPGYNSGVQMPLQQFPEQPPIGFIYASSAPPPYPGLNTGPANPPPPAYPQQQSHNSYPQNQPSQPGYPTGQPGYPAGYPGQDQGPQQPGYPGQAPAQSAPSYPQPTASGGYPPQNHQQQSGSGYPPQQDQSNMGYPSQQSSAGYPDLSAATAASNQNQPSGQPAWPSAPSFNPNWQNDKKNN